MNTWQLQFIFTPVSTSAISVPWSIGTGRWHFLNVGLNFRKFFWIICQQISIFANTHGTVLIVLSYKAIVYKFDKEICWGQRKLKEGSEGEQDKHTLCTCKKFLNNLKSLLNNYILHFQIFFKWFWTHLHFRWCLFVGTFYFQLHRALALM